MPLLGQVQHQLGIGGGGATAAQEYDPADAWKQALQPAGGGGAPGGGAPINGPAPTPGVDPAWSRIFGTATPGELLGRRAAGAPLAPSAPAAPGTATDVAFSPQDAGTLNASAPGVFNGNPDNGFSQTQQDGGQSNNEQGGPPPNPMADALERWRSSGGATPPIAPGSPDPGAAARYAGVPAPAPAAAPTPAPGVTTGMGIDETTGAPQAGAAGMTVADAQQESVAPPAGAAATQGAEQTQESAAGPSGPAKAAEASAGTPVRLSGIDYTLNTGSKLPAAWDSLTHAQKIDFLTKHATPANQAQFDASKALNAFPNTAKVNLPSTNPLTSPVNITPEMFADPKTLRAALGGDSGLNELALRYSALTTQILHASGLLKPAQMSALTEEQAAIANAMKGYGVTFGPAPTTTTPGDTTNDQNSQDTTVHNTVTDSEHGVVSGQPPADANPNTVLSQPATSLMDYFKRFTKGGFGDKAMAMAEAAFAADQQQAQTNNRQNSVNLMSSAVGNFSGSPLYTGSQDLAGQILKNPDPVPWDLVNNQYVSSRDKLAENIVGNLSGSAARRGLSTGAVQGIQGQMLGQAANEEAAGLGQLKVQQAVQGRQSEMDALRTALTTLAGTSGVDIANVGNLANLIAGNATDYQNPYSGIASAFANIDALVNAADVANQARNFTWQDAAQLFGQLSGSAAQAFGPRPKAGAAAPKAGTG